MSRSLGTSTIAILAALKSRVCYGLDLTQRTGLMPGTVYTTLRRLEARKLVEGQWEDPAIAEAERRPRRRYYSLTPAGIAALEDASERLSRLARGVRRQVSRMSER
jgi:DNA-binding PadR family transcriptional regulator